MLPLVCIDVDGTLIGSSGEPTPAVWAAAEAAVERGQHLALCTARAAFGPTWEYARRLDPSGWHVFHAGGALVHTGSDEVRQHALAGHVIEQCLALSSANGWVLERYGARDYGVNSSSPLAVGHARLMGVPLAERPLDDVEGEPVRLQFVVPIEETDTVLAAGIEGAEMTAATSPAQPEAAFISVTAPGISKGTAITEIAASLGTSVDRVMMVGDGHNDIDAMNTVGHPTAMANAVRECAEAATHHVGDVDADGLVEALELSASL